MSVIPPQDLQTDDIWQEKIKEWSCGWFCWAGGWPLDKNYFPLRPCQSNQLLSFLHSTVPLILSFATNFVALNSAKLYFVILLIKGQPFCSTQAWKLDRSGLLMSGRQTCFTWPITSMSISPPNTLTDTLRTIFTSIWAPHGPVKFTHKLNHHKDLK